MYKGTALFFLLILNLNLRTVALSPAPGVPEKVNPFANISFTYESIDGKGYNSASPPTAIGKYKAIAVIDNNCPYEIDGVYLPASLTDTVCAALSYVAPLGALTVTSPSTTLDSWNTCAAPLYCRRQDGAVHILR